MKNALLFLLVLHFFSGNGQGVKYNAQQLQSDILSKNYKSIATNHKVIVEEILPLINSDYNLNNLLIELCFANDSIGMSENSLKYGEMFVSLNQKILKHNWKSYEVGLVFCVNKSIELGDNVKTLKYASLGIELLDTVTDRSFENDYILFLENAASIQFDTGDFKNAARNYFKLTIIYGNLLQTHNKEYHEAKLMLGCCFLQTKQYTKAEKEFLNCLQYLNQTKAVKDNVYSQLLNGLFGCYVLNAKIKEADEISEECIELTVKNYGKKSLEYAQLSLILATYYSVKGELNFKSFQKENLTQSKEYFQQSIDFAIQSIKYFSKFPKMKEYLKESNGILALSHFYLGQYEVGLTYAQLAENNAILTFYYLQLGYTSKSDSVFIQFYKQQVNDFELNSLNLADEELTLIKARQFNFTNIGLLNYLKLRGNKNQDFIQYCFSNWINFNASVLSRSRELSKMLKSTENNEIWEVYSKQRLIYEQWNKLVESNMSSIEVKQIKLYEDSLILLSQQLNSLLSFEKKYKQSLSIADLKSMLVNNNAYVEIVRVPVFNFLTAQITDSVNYHAFILQNDITTSVDHIIIENEDDLEMFVDDLSNKNNEFNYNKTNAYNSFWKPIADKIGDAKTVYVSLGGVYNNINLSALYNPETGKYLIEEKDIRIVNSARDFVLMKEREKKVFTSNTSALYGFPDFNGNTSMTVDTIDYFALTRDLDQQWIDSLTRGGMKASPLPSTKVEVDQIAGTFQKNAWNVKMNTGMAASEGNIKQEESPRVLHIATHGYFFEDIPLDKTTDRFLGMDRQRVVQDPMLRSGLLMTGANKTLQGEEMKGENGLLSAAEASLIDLRETELVVLSACETGKGEVKNSEGVYGLRKAFSDAGARNVIMSLWKVDDKVTQEFMSCFYEIWLNEKTSIREAFNRTQLEIKAKYPQPYYWGAFIIVGE